MNIRVMTYSEQISEFIKQALINGDLEPGQRIKEVELAQRLSISRAPVREALNLLVKDGLITYAPQKGKFVRTLSPSEIEQEYFMGGVLEAAALGDCIDDITDTDIEALEEIVDEMAKFDCADPEQKTANAKLDHEFHMLLTKKTKQISCVEHGRRQCERMSKFLLVRYWSNIFTKEEIVKRHRDIVEAVKTKDKWHVEETIRNHYKDLGKKMSQYGFEKDR